MADRDVLDKLAELLKSLIGSGAPVAQFREVAGDLEEAFITATQENQEVQAVTAEVAS